MLSELVSAQIELEKEMTECSIANYRKELEKAKQNGQFSCTPVAVKLLSRILDDFTGAIRDYLSNYMRGRAVSGTMAAETINRLNDVEAVAFLTSKIILNAMWSNIPIVAMYKAIGQGIEDEYKMREFKRENHFYYDSIQKDLNQRGAKAQRKKNITTGVFNHRLDFHLDRWTITEKFQTGLVLTRIFVESTGLAEYEDVYRKNKHYKFIVPTNELVTWVEMMNEKLELIQPFFLPMVCPPKEWVSVLEGGYISPYLRKNKLIKNNSKDYLQKLETMEMPMVYEAINHLQATKWQVNKQVLDVVKALWSDGKAVAELPDREDESLIPFPFPDKTKDDPKTPEELEIIKKWKRDTYEIHKRNVQKRSIRLLCSQIIRLADRFKAYDSIWFPYQMDFRGRLYPIPVLLQPQGSDLAKGLLQFAEGKPVDEDSVKWLKIHGANMFGFDKESYDARIRWVEDRATEIKSYAEDPLLNRGWTTADKPFQFLAFCFEYSAFLSNPSTFRNYIPIQLDGTCNGLQHYSALLRDLKGGTAVNLVNGDKPSDIYATVAHRLEEKLHDIHNTTNISSADYSFADKWIKLGINRKLTKRPVMVLPYGGTLLSCRAYIGEYLTDNYSSEFLWEHFGIGGTPNDCVFKSSVWLSKYLWEAIQETLKSAIVGMAYLRKLVRFVSKEHKNEGLEWTTPAGLLVKQAYAARKKKMIRTELYGNIIKCTVNIDQEDIDTQRQLNGICPNFIHSLDAACLMLYLHKCKQANINNFMAVHDSYGTYASDTERSAAFLREAFVEVYQQPVLENLAADLTQEVEDLTELPELPEKGELEIEEVLRSDYFFN